MCVIEVEIETEETERPGDRERERERRQRTRWISFVNPSCMYSVQVRVLCQLLEACVLCLLAPVSSLVIVPHCHFASCMRGHLYAKLGFTVQAVFWEGWDF